MKLRDTAAGDIAAITAIYGTEVRDGTASFELDPPDAVEMERRWRDLAGRSFPHIIAEDEGGIVGYAYAGPYRPRPAYRFTVENSVYVNARARRGGVGRLLLAELIRRCEAGGFRQMIAVIGGGSEQPASVGMHRALGFRTIGTIEAAGFKHGRWLDTLLMQRTLGPGRDALPEES